MALCRCHGRVATVALRSTRRAEAVLGCGDRDRVDPPARLRLDERVYQDVPALDNFIQSEPREGELASEPTDAWIFFDDRNIYVAARCWDSQPERMVANEMRRDASTILRNENFSFIFDTFYEKRNGLFFQISSVGGLRDALVTDETNQNNDWNGVWDARTAMFDGGWAVEVVIPFKTLRYQAGPNQVWGVNMRRILQYQNEWSFLAPIPAFLMGQGSIRAVSFAGTMVGLEVPPPGLNLEIKPYGITDLRTDRNASPAFTNEASGDYGVDVKYGITKSLTLDLTYNTDFAQVEDDQQQINLTRFNLFFPEKREFFLEGRDIFAFGRATGRGNTPVLFFSRRIGLESGQSVPIVGGARMTGKTGPYSAGLLNIQSDDDVAADARATNFSVVRVKRDILRRSVIGAIYTRRQETGPDGAEPGETFGVDALYSSSRSLYLTGTTRKHKRLG